MGRVRSGQASTAILQCLACQTAQCLAPWQQMALGPAALGEAFYGCPASCDVTVKHVVTVGDSQQQFPIVGKEWIPSDSFTQSVPTSFLHGDAVRRPPT